MARRSRSERTRRKRSGVRKEPSRHKLAFEPLEDRRLLSITVDTTLDVVDLNDGLTSLREAILAANTVAGADTIEFAPALTAGGPATILLTQGELAITDALTIDGPGAELLTIDASGNDPTSDDQNGDGSRIFAVDDNNSVQTIDVAIADLHLSGGDSSGFGGGAITNREYLTIADTVIDNNAASASEPGQFGGNGGAIYNVDGTVVVLRSTISGNSAMQGGGGIYNRNGNIQVTNSALVGNDAGVAERGGGIYSSYGTVMVTDTVITRNAAAFSTSSGGGGIYCRDGDLTVVSSMITGNIGGSGGGIAVANASLIVETTTISGNQAGTGGGVYSWRSTINLVLSTISNNFGGGGLYVWGSILSGIATTVRFSTITANRANNAAGGIFSYDPVLVDHSIIAGNIEYHLFESDETDDVRGPIATRFSLIGVSRDGTITDDGETESACNLTWGRWRTTAGQCS